MNTEMDIDVLLRLDLVRVEISRMQEIKNLPVWAPAPLIEACFYELTESATTIGQIFDAADMTNRIARHLPMRIQYVDVLTYGGESLTEYRWINPMVQLLFPATGSSRREKSWDSEDLRDFRRIAVFPVSFPEKPLPAN